MKNKSNLKKGILCLVLISFIFTNISFILADSNGIWHYSEDIKGGTFGDDESPVSYTFKTKVNFLDIINGTKYCLNSNCINKWPVSFIEPPICKGDKALQWTGSNWNCKSFKPSCNDECSYSGQKTCSGNYLKTCGDHNSDGCLEWKQSYCSYGCSGNSCDSAPSCSDQCSYSGQKTCSGNTLKTCGNYDSDNCLEWNLGTTCSSGTTCSGDRCVSSSPSPSCDGSVITYTSKWNKRTGDPCPSSTSICNRNDQTLARSSCRTSDDEYTVKCNDIGRVYKSGKCWNEHEQRYDGEYNNLQCEVSYTVKDNSFDCSKVNAEKDNWCNRDIQRLVSTSCYGDKLTIRCTQKGNKDPLTNTNCESLGHLNEGDVVTLDLDGDGRK